MQLDIIDDGRRVPVRREGVYERTHRVRGSHKVQQKEDLITILVRFTFRLRGADSSGDVYAEDGMGLGASRSIEPCLSRRRKKKKTQ